MFATLTILLGECVELSLYVVAVWRLVKHWDNFTFHFHLRSIY